MEIDLIESSLVNYLASNNWEYFRKDKKIVFSKKQIKGRTKKFNEGPPKYIVTYEKINSFLKDFFTKKDYSLIEPMDIVNKESTIFVSSGVQIFTSSTNSKEFESGYIAQPVIRSQFSESKNKNQGFLSSFVNVGTEKINVVSENYVNQLDEWLSCLSELGLYAGDLTLEGEKTTDNWGSGSFSQYALRMYYRNLEISDFVFIEDINIDNNKKNICDFGLGIERLLWALNKTKNFIDSVYPGISSLEEDVDKIDAIRTATLLAASDVEVGNKDENYHLKKILKKITSQESKYLVDLIDISYDYWSEFSNLRISKYDTTDRIVQEINKQKNKIFDSNLGLKSPDSVLKLNTPQYFKMISSVVPTRKLENL